MSKVYSEPELVRTYINWYQCKKLATLFEGLAGVRIGLQQVDDSLTEKGEAPAFEGALRKLDKIQRMTLGANEPENRGWRLETDEDLVNYLEKDLAKTPSDDGKGTMLDVVFPNGTDGLSIEERLNALLALEEVKGMAKEGAKLVKEMKL